MYINKEIMLSEIQNLSLFLEITVQPLMAVILPQPRCQRKIHIQLGKFDVN